MDKLRPNYQFDLSKPIDELIRLEKVYCKHVSKLVKFGTIQPSTKSYLLTFFVIMCQLTEHYKAVDPDFCQRLAEHTVTYKGSVVKLENLLAQYHIQPYNTFLIASFDTKAIDNEYSNIWLHYIQLREHLWALALKEDLTTPELYDQHLTPF